jgi:hypothetical protein
MMEIDLSTDTAPSPERTLQLAETFAELARVLNHQTRHHEALRNPADADRLIRELSTAAARLPQLLRQVTAWLNAEYEEGRIRMADGADPEAAYAVLGAGGRLESAPEYATLLHKALDRAAGITSRMEAAEGSGDA